jgi:hypothetical protein
MCVCGRGINPMATQLAIKHVLVGGRAFRKIKSTETFVVFSVTYVSLLLMQSIADKRALIINVILIIHNS